MMNIFIKRKEDIKKLIILMMDMKKKIKIMILRKQDYKVKKLKKYGILWMIL